MFDGALLVATLSSLALAVGGHSQARDVYEHQPARVAAFEGLDETPERGAGLLTTDGVSRAIESGQVLRSIVLFGLLDLLLGGLWAFLLYRNVLHGPDDGDEGQVPDHSADALFLVLFGLALRAVSIEFCSKLASPRWRSVRGHVFFASSVLVTFLFGVARRRRGVAFGLSCLSVAAFVALLGIALFSNLVASSVDPATNSLTIYNASSSARRLEIMLLIAALGMPLVLTYTAIVYWTFRGEVELDAQSD